MVKAFCPVQERGHKALGQSAALSHLAQMAAFMAVGVWWLLEPSHYGPAQASVLSLASGRPTQALSILHAT